MVILVSGASYGLGFELVKLGLMLGCIMVAGVRPQDGRHALEGLKTSPERLYIVDMDVTSDEQVASASQYTDQHIGTVDVLINVAGVIHRPYPNSQPVSDIPLEELHRQFDVNVFGAMRVSKYFLPNLLKSKQPSILNITSEAGSFTQCAYCFDPYSLSKTMMNVVSYRMGLLLAAKGVRTLAIHPGRMRTNMSNGNGTIGPDEAARGIMKLAMRETAVEANQWFVDYNGRPMQF